MPEREMEQRGRRCDKNERQEGNAHRKRYRVKELPAIAGITSQTLRRQEELGIFAPEQAEEAEGTLRKEF